MMKHLFFVFVTVLWLPAFTQQGNCHTHTVQPGEGVFSISRLYSLKPSQIMAVNPEIGKEMLIKTGQKLCIPKNIATIPPSQIEEAKRVQQIEKNFQTRDAATAVNPTKQGDIWIHTVLKGETFYSICKLYDVLAYDMISANNLPNTILAENQKLILPPTAVLPGEHSIASDKPVSAVVEMAKSPDEKVETAKMPAKDEKKVAKDTSPKKSGEKAVINETQTSIEKKIETTRVPTKDESPKTETYTVQKGDTYFSLTRKFNLQPDELKQLNNLANTDIKIGQTLKVATPQTEKKEDENVIPNNAVVIDIAKEVAKREEQKKMDETIAEKIEKPAFDVAVKKEKEKKKTEKSVEENPEVKVSVESEIVAQEPMAEVKPAQPEAITPAADETLKEDVKTTKSITVKPVVSFSDEYGENFAVHSSNNNYRLMKQRGVAVYSENISGNEYLAYFNGAEPGSILKVTNLMNRQHAFVKVIGKTSEAKGENSMLTISKKLAAQLKAIDNQFLVEVSLYAKN